jgi:hypothetical protein
VLPPYSCPTLKIETKCFSETLVSTVNTTWYPNPEDQSGYPISGSVSHMIGQTSDIFKFPSGAHKSQASRRSGDYFSVAAPNSCGYLLWIVLRISLLAPMYGGPGSLSRYSWTVRGSNPGGSEIFLTRPDRPWGPPSLLHNGYRVSFSGVKRPRHGVDHPSPSSAEAKERLELYLYSPSGYSWPVLG